MAKIIKKNVKEKVRDLKREGKRQGEHFLVRKGILYILPIPKSKMHKAFELQNEGVSVEEISRIIEEDVDSLLEWYDQ